MVPSCKDGKERYRGRVRGFGVVSGLELGLNQTEYPCAGTRAATNIHDMHTLYKTSIGVL